MVRDNGDHGEGAKVIGKVVQHLMSDHFWWKRVEITRTDVRLAVPVECFVLLASVLVSRRQPLKISRKIVIPSRVYRLFAADRTASTCFESTLLPLIIPTASHFALNSRHKLFIHTQRLNILFEDDLSNSRLRGFDRHFF